MDGVRLQLNLNELYAVPPSSFRRLRSNGGILHEKLRSMTLRALRRCDNTPRSLSMHITTLCGRIRFGSFRYIGEESIRERSYNKLTGFLLYSLDGQLHGTLTILRLAGDSALRNRGRIAAAFIQPEAAGKTHALAYCHHINVSYPQIQCRIVTTFAPDTRQIPIARSAFAAEDAQSNKQRQQPPVRARHHG